MSFRCSNLLAGFEKKTTNVCAVVSGCPHLLASTGVHHYHLDRTGGHLHLLLFYPGGILLHWAGTPRLPTYIRPPAALGGLEILHLSVYTYRVNLFPHFYISLLI